MLVGKDILYILPLYIQSKAKRKPVGFILCCIQVSKTWTFEALRNLGPEKKKGTAFWGENHLWGSSFDRVLGFPRRFSYHPKTNEVWPCKTGWAQSGVTAAEMGPFITQAQTGPLATLLQAGYYLRYSYCLLTKTDGTQCLGEEPWIWLRGK